MSRGRCSPALVAVFVAESARAWAQELPVRIEGDAPSPIIARVRAELEALGHHAADASTRAAVLVRVTPSTRTPLSATVVAPDRAPVEVEVDAAQPDAEALFAIRIAEAVRASVLRPPDRVATPAPAVVVVPQVIPQTERERDFGLGLGVRALASPGGVSPMLMPFARASLDVGRGRVGAVVDVSFAGPSLLGDAGASSSLSVIEVGVGGAAAIRVSSNLRAEVGGRLSFLALRFDVGGAVQASARDGQWAASAVLAARWSPHARVSLRAGASIGATLGAVDLGIGATTVAEWGRPLAGVEVGAEARF